PTRAAWALNRVARTDPGLMSGFLTTASELAEAQERLLASGDREAFAAALAGHRAALEELLAAVRTELAEGGAAAGAMLERARTPGGLRCKARRPALPRTRRASAPASIRPLSRGGRWCRRRASRIMMPARSTRPSARTRRRAAGRWTSRSPTCRRCSTAPATST